MFLGFYNFDRYFMSVELGCHFEERNQTESVREYGAEEDICA
jgi:hypothetical protein